MEVSLVVVNYNGLVYLEKTLAEIDPKAFAQVILVDNASTDGSVEWVRANHPDLRVLALPENGGPSAARQAGLEAAPTDRIVFIDNDVIPQPGCVEALTAALDAHPNAILAMPRIVYDDDLETCQFDGAGAHCSGLMTIENPDTPVAQLPRTVRRLNSLIGACFLTDRRLWGDQPITEPLFFVYFEDHETGVRARMLGHDILAVPDGWVRHGAGSIGVSLRQTGRFTSVRIRNTMLGRWRVLGKLFRLRTLVLMAPALALFELCQAVGAVKKGWTRDYLAALGTFVRQLPRLWRARRAFQPHRKLPDRAVLEGGPLPLNPALPRGVVERFVQRVLDAAFRANWALARRIV